MVSAAGNSDWNLDPQNDSDYDPSVYSNIPCAIPAINNICVASSDQNGGKSGFSSYGRFSVDVAAPGSGILSTLLNESYGVLSGTSMATPMVSGLAAMLMAFRPFLDAEEIRDLILDNVLY
jgi:subtilisin family serine protease